MKSARTEAVASRVVSAEAGSVARIQLVTGDRLLVGRW